MKDKNLKLADEELRNLAVSLHQLGKVHPQILKVDEVKEFVDSSIGLRQKIMMRFRGRIKENILKNGQEILHESRKNWKLIEADIIRALYQNITQQSQKTGSLIKLVESYKQKIFGQESYSRVVNFQVELSSMMNDMNALLYILNNPESKESVLNQKGRK